ncbi:hypothetical protein NNC19_02675 [Clostridium sp. SHJSY1]|uniref:hypothetical protein n=1 Tax=Clostridium sp. SHJSY1 TaxID=2942483 RepID=UPI0028757E28|nr:hypothetical protein [Clostridium sp. SHJSY1]MDS0524566.1 hypothetical protein [Clostridium sp. SHJSY1]
MGEKRMEYGYIDILFLNIGEITYNIKGEGINSFSLLQERVDYNDIVYRYLDKGIKLARKGYINEKLKGELSFELSKICGNSKIDDTRFKALHIIKSLIVPMINGDHELILEFSKYYCNKNVYAILSQTFKKFYI